MSSGLIVGIVGGVIVVAGAAVLCLHGHALWHALLAMHHLAR